MKKNILFFFMTFANVIHCFCQDTHFNYLSPGNVVYGKEIEAISPKNAEKFKTFTIDPKLPEGLNIDSGNGKISGTPWEILANNTYTVSAISDKGLKGNAKVTLKVLPKNFLDAGTIWWTIIILVFLFALAVILVIILNKKKVDTEALGLPNGSVRAIIAIFLVFFLIILSVLFFLNSDNSDLTKQISIQLFTLVSTVVAFYFGSKASEQSQQNVAETQRNTIETQKNTDLTQKNTDLLNKAIDKIAKIPGV